MDAVHLPLSLDHPALVQRLRERLAGAPFTTAAVADALGAHDAAAARAAGLAVQLRQLEGAGPFGTLVRLLVLGQPAPLQDAAQAVAPLGVDDLERLGLLSVRDGQACPRLRIVPHEDLLVACDLPLQHEAPAPADHVPGVQHPSVTLAHLTVHRAGGTFLDLGTGCGIEALLAAPQAARVLATDVSARAVNFAAFNAQINGLPNVECRTGSWFEPVGDERFDTLVCNPPFVISPASEFVYRDSGMVGDSVSEQVVRTVPAHLAEGGFATLQISWIVDPDGDPSEAPRRWVAGSGCDAWLLHYRTDRPLDSAAIWNQSEAPDPQRQAQRLDEWLAYYRRLGIRGIAYGSLVLRRRAGAPWFRLDTLPQDRLKPAGEHIRRVFSAQDFLAGAGDGERLLAARMRVVPGVVVEQQLRFHDGRPRAQQMTLSMDEGIGFQAGLDAEVMFLLTQLDGRRTLREALGEAARRGGVADVERYARAGLPLLRRMFELGFLERVAPD